MAQIAAVSLDLWGTLIRSNPDFKSRRNTMLRRRLDVPTSQTQFDAALSAACRDADAAAEATGTDEGLRERVSRCLALLNVHRTITDEQWLDMDAQQSEIAAQHAAHLIDPSIPDVLHSILAHVPVIATSNTGMLPGRVMRGFLDRAGLGDCFSDLVFSNEVGACKPHPQIFRATQVASGVPNENRHLIWHVGDNVRADIAGARTYGFTSMLVNVNDGTPIGDALSAIHSTLTKATP